MDAVTSSDTKATRNPVAIERTSDREIVVTRTFNGPVRLVFQAWTTPDLFRQWWLPQSMGMQLQALEMDARTGGYYRLDFGNGAEFHGNYVEVTPHSRIVWTNDEGGEGGEGGSVTTVTFEERDGQTHVVMTEIYPSKEALEEGAGAEDATHETFGQLDDLLASLQEQGSL
ncbi:MAG: Activator of Hsp90 ATPase [Frankiales bacterium]|nr:Activator of Hsp90 ATPase [Frankiales bacterium]